jgi:hypothetical protein
MAERMVLARWHCQYLFHAQAGEDVQDYLQQLGGLYVVHTPRGEVHFHKDEQGLPYIDLTESGHKAARMLLQMVEDTKADEDQTVKVGANFVQTVRGNYEGYTKQEVLQAKEAPRDR